MQILPKWHHGIACVQYEAVAKSLSRELGQETQPDEVFCLDVRPSLHLDSNQLA